MQKMLFRKGMEGLPIKAIAGILLLLVSFALILALITQFASRTTGPAAEQLCRTTNAVRLGLFPGLVRDISGGPQGCQSLPLEMLPTGRFSDYKDKKEGIKAQIADRAARCWWMYLEGVRGNDGKNLDVLDAAFFGDKDCAPCYEFYVPSDVSITGGDILDYMRSEPRFVTDASDQCTFEGGSYCRDECGAIEINGNRLETKERDGHCSVGKKCCVAVSTTDECVAKGGVCLSETKEIIQSNNREHVKHTWKCPNDLACYVDKSHYITYFDYIQGGGKGKGYFDLSKGIGSGGLNAGVPYYIIFGEDTSSALAAGITLGISTAESKELDFVLVATLDEVKNMCTLQYGAGGK